MDLLFRLAESGVKVSIDLHSERKISLRVDGEINRQRYAGKWIAWRSDSDWTLQRILWAAARQVEKMQIISAEIRGADAEETPGDRSG